MTNREKYAQEILDVACVGRSIAMFSGKITECVGIGCDECGFGGNYNCRKKIEEWANSEYVDPPVDWSKVAVDTPILVRDSNDEAWKRRYFAKYEDGYVCAFKNGATSWSSHGGNLRWNYAKLAERANATIKNIKKAVV